MTKQDKELLLKDLCARLPYHPIIQIYNDCWEGCKIGEFDNTMGYHHVEAFLCDRIEILPYLRPMSSMTEEEDKQFALLQTESCESGYLYVANASNLIDFCNKRHLDFRGLIEKGLALEAPEGMYKF